MSHQKNDFIMAPFQTLLIRIVQQINDGMQTFADGDPFPLWRVLRACAPQLPDSIKDIFYPQIKKDKMKVESFRKLNGINMTMTKRIRNEEARFYLLSVLEDRVDELSSLFDKEGFYTKIKWGPRIPAIAVLGGDEP